MATKTGFGVGRKHPQYDKFTKKWKRCRDVAAGRDAVIAGGELYLPKLKAQEPDDYLAYRERATYYNATWRTIAGFVGLMFRKPPKLEVAAPIKTMLDDVTMSGISFEVFAQDIELELLTVSRVGVLVDHPKTVNTEGKTLTVVEAQRLGMRPSMQKYPTENILNWETSFINNRTVLSQVRLSETKITKISEFEAKELSVIRVLDLFEGRYRVRLFDATNETQIDEDVFPEMDGAPLTEIPFYILGPDGVDLNVTDPVLIDLVDLNLAHYRVSADYEQGCHVAGIPTPVITGYQNTDPSKPLEFTLGCNYAWVIPDVGAKAAFLEFTGQGLQELRENLNSKKAEMAAIGARMISPEKTGVEAAETLSLRNAGEHAILSAMALATSIGLTSALVMFSRWGGGGDKALFQINRDFVPLNADPALITAWIAAMQSGALTKEEVFDLFQRADMIDAEMTFEQHQANIDQADITPPVAAPGAQPKKEDAGV